MGPSNNFVGLTNNVPPMDQQIYGKFNEIFNFVVGLTLIVPDRMITFYTGVGLKNAHSSQNNARFS